MSKFDTALEFFEWLIEHDSAVRSEFSCYDRHCIVADFVRETTPARPACRALDSHSKI